VVFQEFYFDEVQGLGSFPIHLEFEYLSVDARGVRDFAKCLDEGFVRQGCLTFLQNVAFLVGKVLIDGLFVVLDNRVRNVDARTTLGCNRVLLP